MTTEPSSCDAEACRRCGLPFVFVPAFGYAFLLSDMTEDGGVRDGAVPDWFCRTCWHHLELTNG